MVAGGGVGGLVGIICGTGGVVKEEEEEEDEEEEVELLLLLSNCRRSINISSSYLMKEISTFSISFFVISVLYYLLLSLPLPLSLFPSPSLSTSPSLFLSHSYCALIR